MVKCLRFAHWTRFFHGSVIKSTILALSSVSKVKFAESLQNYQCCHFHNGFLNRRCGNLVTLYAAKYATASAWFVKLFQKWKVCGHLSIPSAIFFLRCSDSLGQAFVLLCRTITCRRQFSQKMVEQIKCKISPLFKFSKVDSPLAKITKTGLKFGVKKLSPLIFMNILRTFHYALEFETFYYNFPQLPDF